MSASPQTSPKPPAPLKYLLRPIGRMSLIWQMIALAFGIHIVLLLVLSPNLFSSDSQSPERLFELGEAELAQGRYSEAMLLFQKVLDMQPKVPPVFEKAAEQHRTAERLARRGPVIDPATRATVVPTDNAVTPATKPATRTGDRPPVTAPATKPANFIPPELQPK